jgi:transcriptional regulator with XRE-family HTH domain
LPDAVQSEARRLSIRFGLDVRERRAARGWAVTDLATRAGLSPEMIYRIESGQAGSNATYARIAVALGRRLELSLVDPRRRGQPPNLSRDVVHSAMAEFEAEHLRRPGVRVGIDEPYQHYQFAGRADVVAWDLQQRALLHIENKTRVPNLQELAGSYNAKRAYLGAALAERAGIRRWASETHVIAGLWSSEVLHVLRLREATFRALGPDGAAGFTAWWSGTAPTPGVTSAVIVLDPLATGRQASLIDLDRAMTAKPRYRGYADVAARLDRAA